MCCITSALSAPHFETRDLHTTGDRKFEEIENILDILLILITFDLVILNIDHIDPFLLAVDTWLLIT